MKIKPTLKLTAENYYSQEANTAYYSVSQIKALSSCAASAMAELEGRYSREKSSALLVGGYVDAYFSGEMDQFKAANPEIFNSRTGALKADFVKAEELIERFKADPLCSYIFRYGQTQRIVTGDVEGYPFKAKLDFWLPKSKARQMAQRFPGMGQLLFADGCIIDMKVMKDFDPVFVPGAGRQTFIEAWHYDLQLAVYQELMRQKTGHKVPCYILAITKESVPNLELFSIDQDAMDTELDLLKKSMKHLNDVKTGVEDPEAFRCGSCPYCRMTKRLSGAVLPEMMLGE